MPVFLEKRVYQGSSGVVYPYPVIESVADEKEDCQWLALFLENRYLKIMILPELGGRVQMALDKTNGYHFIYYNRVIKPALVGLAGPWISGGIEFNWPQHHRPNTFGPVNWRIDDGADGSKTIWCAEYEIMFNTKGMHGFRLYPDRAYLEIDVQLYNRTSEAQTFLWWANPAVHVNDDYQSIFPPDVHAVMDHGKRAVSDFPIATGTYYKVNYAPGTDISRYKNIPVPTSYMAYHSDFDFIGCYDHGKQAGMMHVANHHVVPGKKQWTWGTSDFGQAWDRQLTDEDGPYIELMCGAYTDNQPDFSWLMPGEEKRFTQTFMPYKGTGGAKNANQEAVINLTIDDNQARMGVYVTRPRSVLVRLLHTGDTIFERTLDLTPERAWVETAVVTYTHALLRRGGHDGRNVLREQDVTLQVFDAANGRKLIEYTPPPDERSPIPAPASPAQPPAAIASNEELFLNGLHLEQYRHANFAPEPYYEEALCRDPYDSRCNNALGLLLYRRGKFAEAELYLRTAIASLTRRNPNPYDGEAFYNLGLTLKLQGRYEQAFAALYKAAWNAAWQDAAYFELARLAARAGRLEEALDLSKRALHRNWTQHKARHLQVALLRRLGRHDSARKEIAIALGLDRLEFGALWEWQLQHWDSSQPDNREIQTGANSFVALAQNNPAVYVETALDYAHAGLFVEAIGLLRRAPLSDPMIKYYLGWVLVQAGNETSAISEFNLAAQISHDYCFPNKLESVLALQCAIRLVPEQALANYALGNFWYAHRRYNEAIACWERCAQLDSRFAVVQRNLGLAYYNQQHNAAKALAAYECAWALDPGNARLLFEYDQLCKKLNHPAGERLARLERYADLVEQRDDLYIERVGLLNQLGRHDEALALLMQRTFHPWEGGEGKATGQYVLALVELAKQRLARQEYAQAIDALQRAQRYPPNLGEGKLHGAQENHIFYWLGCAYAGLADEDGRSDELAHHCWAKAAVGLNEPTSALYYNDQPPEMIYYQGLALSQLGREAEARAIFEKLVAYGQSHLNDQVTMDYFAVSLPDFLVFEDDLTVRNRIHCHFMLALGRLGLGETEEARHHFDQALALNAHHLGVLTHRI
jgi:tetratricopeptide (TPR) repeat protein